MNKKYQEVFDKAIKHKEDPDEMSEYYFVKECEKIESQAVQEGITGDVTEKLIAIATKAFVTNEFLQNVERLARYNGDDFSVGDADTSVKNLGTIVKKGRKLDMSFAGGSKNFKLPDEVYDVTYMTDNATTFNHDKYLIIAERQETKSKNYPPKIYIYSVCGYKKDVDELKSDGEITSEDYGDRKYEDHPTIERVLKDFKKDNYTFYNNLIDGGRDRYTLTNFNVGCDRITCASVFNENVNSVMFEEGDRFKDIEVADYQRGIERIR